MPGSLTVRPAGNSPAINKIEDGEMRALVHELYQPFWDVWSGPFNFIPIVILFLFFSLFMLAGAWIDGNAGQWRAIAWLAGEAGLSYGLVRFIKNETASIRRGRRRFAELVRFHAKGSEAFQRLCKIEPIRMWFLKSTLVPPATTSPTG